MDLLSYALGLLTAGPVLLVAAFGVWLADHRAPREPGETAGRFELIDGGA